VLQIVFFRDPIFDIPQLYRFIGRTGSLRPLNPAQLQFSEDADTRILLESLPAIFW
jgi:hypothetical protein